LLVRPQLVGGELELMDVTFGWSLDLSGARRRLAALLAAALLAGVAVIPAPALAAGYDPATDPYSMANTATAIGATAWWNAGYTGAGVDVAVIDTGVAPVPGLDGAGKIVYGPDLSLESQAPNLRNRDTAGHGTFMAGLIAANSADYKGVAPDARIVSVKVGVADGGVDVSQVIAAINWVVEHKTDNGLNIRVLNLSYGTNSSPLAHATDPLSYAVEQAWKKGIVVVAAVGNDRYTNKGQSLAGLSNPASNPFVLSVGAADTMGTATYGDDTVAAFSTKNTLSCANAGCKNPDLIAAGSHLQGLRVPNGHIDANHPTGRLGDRYFRGSGASQATAITSGAVALILQKFPNAAPDQVRKFLKSNAVSGLSGCGPKTCGSGELSLTGMLGLAPTGWVNSATPSTGTGKLDLARGSDRLTDDGVVLSGEKDVFGHTWNAAAMATATASGNTWSGGTWNGNTWSGNTWSGNTWSGNTWSGNSWSGNTWSGNTWSGNTWSGNTWSGNTWSGNSWSGNTWSGNTWSTGGWN
jgi:serine protease AprX